MRHTLLAIYGWFMILAPITNWIILCNKSNFVWDTPKLTLMVLFTIIGLVAGVIILNVPRLNRQIDKENAGGYTQSFRKYMNDQLN